ncbi:hypothetical protein ACFQO4_19355 [Saliphagus sp. GCM10025334]
MKRRKFLATTGTTFSISLVGCLSAPTSEGNLRSPENFTGTEVATATFDESETPICASGGTIDSTIEGDSELGTITNHEFFQDDTGRYGVRGRYEGGYFQWIDATFFSGTGVLTETRHNIYGFSGEPYEFMIVTSEGDSSEIDNYQLTLPDGANSGPGPSTKEGLELLEKGWGVLGTSGNNEVYGFAATIQNTEAESVRQIYMRVKSHIDDNTLVHTDQGFVRELEPMETYTFYSPYLRCDPGDVSEVDFQYFRLQDA